MDKYFHDLLARYAEGKCSEEEVRKVHRWFEEIGDNRLGLEEHEKQQLKERMFENISAAFPSGRVASRGTRLLVRDALKIAATLLVVALCVAGYFGGFFSREGARTADNLSRPAERVLENQTNRVTTYTLSDGSTVRLEPSGKLRLPSNFSADMREVYLTGRAFFNIVSDPERPFIVYSHTVATRVLGTSFFVDASANSKRVEVKVITGKVSVSQIKAPDASEERENAEKSDSIANGVVLTPNQKVEYFIEENRWVTGLVEEPLPLNPSEPIQDHTLVFADTPVGEVFSAINKRYGIELVAQNEKIYQCTFTGDVSAMSLYDMLDVISNSIGSTYEVKGTRILVSGKGCN